MRNELLVRNRQEGGVRERPTIIKTVQIFGSDIASVQTIFTVNTPAFILRHLAVACRGTADELTMYAVPEGASAGVGNLQLVDFPVAPNTAVDLTDLVTQIYEKGTRLQVFSTLGTGQLLISGWGQELL